LQRGSPATAAAGPHIEMQIEMGGPPQFQPWPRRIALQCRAQ